MGQVDCLLSQPLRDEIVERSATAHFVLVLDALDECADENASEQLLKELVSVAHKLPIKILITSRPERHIRLRLESRTANLNRVIRLHDIEADIVAADISCYLTNRFRDIRSDLMEGLGYGFPPEWPSLTDIAVVTQLAGKLFIYAFTAVEYIRQNDPVGRLQKLTGLASGASDTMTVRLEEMYLHVLSDALSPRALSQDDINDMKYILASILVVREPFSVSALSDLIGMPIQHLKSLLDRLHAVIYVPLDDESRTLATFHASILISDHDPARGAIAPGRHIILRDHIELLIHNG